jgi:hypothetical protein
MNKRQMGKTVWLACLFAAFATFGISGCAKAESPSAGEAAPEAKAEAPATAPNEKQAQPSGERKVIHKADLTLSSEDVRRAADSAVAIVTRVGGYIAQRDERHAEDHVVQSRLTLRVPADHFQRVLDELKAGGSVVEERITGQDVTLEFSDVEASLRSLSTLEARLLTLTSSRDGVKDLLEVERELERVRSEIERFSGRRQWLTNQTEFASIELVILSPEQPAVAGTEGVLSRFGNAFSDGIDSGIDVMTGLIRVGFTLAPLAPLAAVAWLVYRIFRRRRAAPIQA